MENQKNKNFFSLILNLKIEDKIFYAIIMSLLSLLISIGLNVFYEPFWVNKIIHTNEQIKSQMSNETLILIGGGTIHEYLEGNGMLNKCYEIIGKNSVIPIRIASLDACKTLKDETESSSTGWVVLSSTKATSEDFMDSKEADEFKRKKRIIEVSLAQDKLVVITTKDECLNQIANEKDKISIDELKNILGQLDSNNFVIFTTSANSGTLKLYKDITGYDFTNFNNAKVFDLNTTYPEKTPYIILCSDIYKPQNYDYNKSNLYHIYSSTDKKNDFIEKELFLYFTANCNGNSMDIPNSIKKFIPIVKKDFDIKNIKLTNALILRNN